MQDCEEFEITLHARGAKKGLAHKLNTEALSRQEEEKLWKSGVLCVDTPQGLANAVFFANGKKFVLKRWP